MGFLKNNPMQSSRAYPVLSDASGFPGSKIGDTSTVATSLTGGTEALRIERGAPLARIGGHLWLWIKAGRGLQAWLRI